MHTHMHTRAHACTHTHTLAHTHTRARAHTHANTHTHRWAYEQSFDTMSSNIITKVDEMGTRIDDLEKTVAELLAASGQQEAKH